MMFRTIVLASLIASTASQEGCSVCGDGKQVTIPDAIFMFPGQPTVPCGLLEAAGAGGAIPLDLCPNIGPLIDSLCGCAEIFSGPTDSPVTSAPVGGPPTAPVPLAAPTESPITFGPVGVPVTEAPASQAPIILEPPLPTGPVAPVVSMAPITLPPVAPEAPVTQPPVAVTLAPAATTGAPINPPPVAPPTQAPVAPSAPVRPPPAPAPTAAPVQPPTEPPSGATSTVSVGVLLVACLAASVAGTFM